MGEKIVKKKGLLGQKMPFREGKKNSKKTGTFLSEFFFSVKPLSFYMLESIGGKNCQKKGLGIKKEKKTAPFSVNSHSLSKYISFHILESIGEKQW